MIHGYHQRVIVRSDHAGYVSNGIESRIWPRPDKKWHSERFAGKRSAIGGVRDRGGWGRQGGIEEGRELLSPGQQIGKQEGRVSSDLPLQRELSFPNQRLL